MTRFARAKGSKASNEKSPNEATPWHVLKPHVNENLSRKVPIEKPKSAKELLQDKDLFYCDVGNVSNDWAKFEEITLTNNRNPITKKNKKKKESFSEISATSNENKKYGDNINSPKKSKKREIDKTDDSTIDVKIKKRKKDKNSFPKINNNLKEEGSADQDNAEKNEAIKKHTKLNTKKKQNKQDDHQSSEISLSSSNISQNKKTEENLLNGESNVCVTEKKKGVRKLSKRKLRQQEKKNNRKSSETSMNSTNILQTNQTEETISNGESNLGVMEKKKGLLSKQNVRQQKKHNMDSKSSNNDMIDQRNVKNKNNENDNVKQQFNKTYTSQSNNYKFHGPKFDRKKFENNKNNNKKSPKVRDDKDHKRRKPEVDSTKLMINGLEIDIVKYDGFPVKKEDADRLRELKQKMIMKGIPKEEIDIAMKLERRRAEKALARIRRCVCFHCRKAGHNLSDCPELESEQAGTGICFKCGSTEHTHFECKVAKPTEFRFATCFICREQGHIAKQCPDNPKGIYPQGGSCKLCGDVTHLKKDCPNLIKEKEENTLTVNTIADGNIESLEGGRKSDHIVENKKPKKIVKF